MILRADGCGRPVSNAACPALPWAWGMGQTLRGKSLERLVGLRFGEAGHFIKGGKAQ